jgi:glycosyltransferase involved in cell wall biosynthesis
MITPVVRTFHSPIRVACIGDDRHRDWQTLVAAFGNRNEYDVRIASRTIDRRLMRAMKNINLQILSHNAQLLALYDWADLLVLPLKANHHASGLTVLQEATVRAVPAICSDTGGLRAYFGDEEVTYVPPGDAAALRAAAEGMARDPQQSEGKVRHAQRRMGEGGFNSRTFVGMHVRLSKELLADRLADSAESEPFLAARLSRPYSIR